MKTIITAIASTIIFAACGKYDQPLRDKRQHFDPMMIEANDATAEQPITHEHDPYNDDIEPFYINDPDAWVYTGQLSKAQLTSFREATEWKVNVLELRYFPVDADGKIDRNATGSDRDVSYIEMKNSVSTMSQSLVKRLAEGSQSLKLGSKPYLQYNVVESKEFKKRVSNHYYDESWLQTYYADHVSMFQADVDICHYVDDLGVRDVWVWMYQNDSKQSATQNQVIPIESNMSMGRISQQFFTHPSHGDISNSYLLNDLPVCKRTYVVYEFNYYRTVAEALHNYGHQRERIYRWSAANLWQSKFENPHGGSDDNSCGNVHFPPNAKVDYDYRNKQTVKSFCTNWSPDLSGATEDISCQNWGCTHENYMVWWNRRIPGRDNNLKDGTRTLRNFHEFFADFDLATAINPSIYQMGIKVAEDTVYKVACPKFWENGCTVLKPEVTKTERLCRQLILPLNQVQPASGNSLYSGGVMKNADSCITDETLTLNDIPVDPSIHYDFYVVFDGEPILKISR